MVGVRCVVHSNKLTLLLNSSNSLPNFAFNIPRTGKLSVLIWATLTNLLKLQIQANQHKRSFYTLQNSCKALHPPILQNSFLHPRLWKYFIYAEIFSSSTWPLYHFFHRASPSYHILQSGILPSQNKYFSIYLISSAISTCLIILNLNFYYD